MTTRFATSFLGHVTRRPEAPALVWRSREISYGQLFEGSRQAAGRIPRLDHGDAVAIIAERSPQTIALVLACLLDGRPCLLLPPTLPVPVLRGVAQQAGCRVVLQADGAEGVLAQPIDGSLGAEGAGVPPPGTSLMLTTSGSTGVPKVVAHCCEGVDRFTEWVSGRFGIDSDTTTVSLAPLNFVVSLLDLWTTLQCGGRVVLVDPARGSQPEYLADLLASYEVSLVQAVPTLFRLLLDVARPTGLRFSSPEHVVSTGDSITAECLAGLAEVFPRARLYNAYGCTETIASFLHEVTSFPSVHGPVPIGQPLPGVDAQIRDDAGVEVVGPGVGELLVTTPFQAAGYLDPAQTSQRFVVDGEGATAVRWFRTGDVVRRDWADTIWLVGRTDFEVKVRGVRINAQEVEQVLAIHPDVVEAAVVPVPDPVDGHRLHAVVHSARNGELNSLVLRRHCAQRLPRGAVPTSFQIGLDPLRRTSTGKLDRQAIARSLDP